MRKDKEASGIKRKANSFTPREVDIACEVLNASLSNSRLSKHRLASEEFSSLFRKFVKMRAQMTGSEK